MSVISGALRAAKPNPKSEPPPECASEEKVGLTVVKLKRYYQYKKEGCGEEDKTNSVECACEMAESFSSDMKNEELGDNLTRKCDSVLAHFESLIKNKKQKYYCVDANWVGDLNESFEDIIVDIDYLSSNGLTQQCKTDLGKFVEATEDMYRQLLGHLVLMQKALAVILNNT